MIRSRNKGGWELRRIRRGTQAEGHPELKPRSFTPVKMAETVNSISEGHVDQARCSERLPLGV
jgi:hypothetical protein